MTIDPKRRTILHGTLAAGALGAAICAGLVLPRRAMATWPKDAFHASEITEALRILTGSGHITPAADKIQIESPDIAEGGTAHISISSSLPNISCINILIPDNHTPLVASFHLGSGVAGAITTRIQMAASGNILAVIEAGEKLYSATKRIGVFPGSHSLP
ncbi:hypothetical protein MNBD_GAMMA26-616 [hydrothermal vent metagenome]|uniref:Ig-like SoxY domain-containing protein n=1 Tax=hydrothermal vent metagenome TaxID=652676 RepID=A0A3B1BMJ9_9ZZZZ